MPPLHKYGVDRIFFPKVNSGRMRYLAWSKGNAAARIKLGPDSGGRKDFFSYLLKARDPETGEGFGMQELWGEANLMIVAGMFPVLMV